VLCLGVWVFVCLLFLFSGNVLTPMIGEQCTCRVSFLLCLFQCLHVHVENFLFLSCYWESVGKIGFSPLIVFLSGFGLAEVCFEI
jgi:hypothetical protein